MKKTCMFLYIRKENNIMLKHVEVTFRDNSIRRFDGVLDDTFERKDSYLRFKNEKGETIYLHNGAILMFSVCDQK